jgi:hypothetical protein
MEVEYNYLFYARALLILTYKKKIYGHVKSDMVFFLFQDRTVHTYRMFKISHPKGCILPVSIFLFLLPIPLS